jgi:hypothetical protein
MNYAFVLFAHSTNSCFDFPAFSTLIVAGIDTKFCGAIKHVAAANPPTNFYLPEKQAHKQPEVRPV